MHTYRLATPGPLLDVAAPSLDAATSRAVELGLPDVNVENGDYLVQFDVVDAQHGVVRRVHLHKRNALRPTTGFALYRAEG